MKAKQFFTLVMILMAGSLIRADDIAVTVYNSNLGVVSETRTLELEKGVNRFAFRDVPALIDPASVRFEISTRESKRPFWSRITPMIW